VVYGVYTVVGLEDVKEEEEVERRSSVNLVRVFGLGVVGTEKMRSAAWPHCLRVRDQVRMTAGKLLVLFEWRSEVCVGGAERGEPERWSAVGEKRDEWESDVRSIGGRDCLRDLRRPRALVYAGYRLG